ncbi:MAG: lipoyl synthase [Candidatus Acetothermia bacterium]
MKKPEWIKSACPPEPRTREKISVLLSNLEINTVCREANCPNLNECWGAGTATFMLLGDRCTRNCRFCDVETGNPKGKLDPEEPEKIGRAVRQLNLEYVVLTSVDRDDLPDGGARHFSQVVESLKAAAKAPKIEALIPDFEGAQSSLELLVRSGPDVIGHNLETVERLTPKVRDSRAGYRQSLEVLRALKTLDKNLFTKSSLMVGLGEEEPEILQAMKDLREAGAEILTIGQYLQPGSDQLPVEKYWSPEEFARLKSAAENLGFEAVVSGPFVRSSYKAKEVYERLTAE